MYIMKTGFEGQKLVGNGSEHPMVVLSVVTVHW